MARLTAAQMAVWVLLATACAGPQTAPPVDPFTRATTARDEGRLADARTAIEPQASKGDLQATMLLAEIDMLQGRHAAAVAVLTPQAEKHTKDPALVALMARALDGAGRGEAALKAWLQRLALVPGDREATERAAELLLARSKPKDAQTVLEAGLHHHPKDAELLALMARALLTRGRLPLALEAARRATAVNPRSPRAWQQLARARTLAGDIDEAVLAYGKVLEIDPNHSAALAGLGGLRLQQRRYAEAIDVLGRATRVNPDNPAVWNALAVAQSRQGLHDDAIESIDKALAAAPLSWQLHRNRAEILLDAGRPEDAVEVAAALTRMKAKDLEPAVAQEHQALLIRAVVVAAMKGPVCEGKPPQAAAVQARIQAALTDRGMSMSTKDIAEVATTAMPSLVRLRARCHPPAPAPDAGARP